MTNSCDNQIKKPHANLIDDFVKEIKKHLLLMTYEIEFLNELGEKYKNMCDNQVLNEFAEELKEEFKYAEPITKMLFYNAIDKLLRKHKQ